MWHVQDGWRVGYWNRDTGAGALESHGLRTQRFSTRREALQSLALALHINGDAAFVTAPGRAQIAVERLTSRVYRVPALTTQSGVPMEIVILGRGWVVLHAPEGDTPPSIRRRGLHQQFKSLAHARAAIAASLAWQPWESA